MANDTGRRLRMTRARHALAAVAVTAALAGASRAAAAPPLQPVSPFDMIGFLESARLGGTDLLAGGSLMVNGQTVVVPRNAVVQFPATFVTWQEVFTLAPAPYGFNGPVPQSGLAMTDVPTPLTTYEVHVQGNRVGDQYIAGLITIAQQSVNAGQGFINFIDYTTGELRVGGVLGDPTTGQRVRVNDPVGRFGRAFTPDRRFTIDEENPNVRTTTAYPLCVPRFDPAAKDDPDCPQENRPLDTTGAYAKTFSMNPPGTSPLLDPTKMAPFEIGDFVTYSGTLVKDGPEPTAGPLTTIDKTYVAAWTVVANVGIYTVPGLDPAYVAIDVSLLGVGGAAQPGLPQEATVRTRFEGFTTDPSRNIDLFGIDVDPCTGAESERSWGSIDVDQGPPFGAVLGRWRFRPPTKVLALPASGTFLPATREMRARIRSSSNVVAANGLTTGQYRAPVAEFLFPENLAVGSPPVPLNLQDFPFLAQGVGPWGANGALVGQLQPWPGKNLPTAPSCAPPALAPPVADAGGPTLSAFTGQLVTLDGSASVDLNGLPLTYQWTQTGGPTVVLSSTAAVRPSFIAPPQPPPPAVPGPFSLTFQLVVSDAAGVSLPATVTVFVDPTVPAALPPIASAGANQTVTSNALVLLDGTGTLDGNTPALALTYAWTQTAGPSVALAGADTPQPTFRAPIAAPGTTVTLTFHLVVTNSAALASAADVTITVDPPLAPIAITGPNQSVLSGATVLLDGTASNDPNGLPLTYAWLQVVGPPVALAGATTATPVFTAPFQPPGTPPVPLAFTLTVSNGFVTSLAAVVTVNVVSGPDVVVITAAVYRVSKQRLTVTALSTTPFATLTLEPIPGAPAQVFTLVAGALTVDILGVPEPPSVTVTSNLGGTATSPITRIR